MKKNSSEKRINSEITSSRCRIVNFTDIPEIVGHNNGDEIDVLLGLSLAKKFDVDLVEISNNNDVSICKLIDYNKYLYQEKKRQKLQKQHQSKSELKEVRLTPNIGSNDLNVKKEQIKKFLKQGSNVKVSMFFRGRELQLMHDEGERILLELSEEMSEFGKLIKMPKMEGKRMIITLYVRH